MVIIGLRNFEMKKLIKEESIEWAKQCEDIVVDDPHAAYYFAMEVPNADIDKLQKFVLIDPYVSYLFARDVEGSDIDKLFSVVKGTFWESYFREEVLKKIFENRVLKNLRNKIRLETRRMLK